MQAVRVQTMSGDVRIGRLEGDTVVDAGPSNERGFVPTGEAWEVLALADGDRFALDQLRLLHPVVPRKIVCIGTNYRDHADESGTEVPPEPIVFAKFPSCLIGPGDPIVVPFDQPETDFEAEVAIVIGTKIRRADRRSAGDSIGGVTCFNDVSGRAAQLGDPGGQFTRGKSFDTFAPLGPAITRARDLVLDELEVRCVVSGEVMQHSTTASLIHDLKALIVYCSAAFTLEPGDVIATGTPGGVGHARTPPRYLRPGDTVDVHVSGVGILRNPVVAEPVAR